MGIKPIPGCWTVGYYSDKTCIPPAFSSQGLGGRQTRDQYTYLIWEYSRYICPKKWSELVSPLARQNQDGFGENNALHQLKQPRNWLCITLGLIYQSIPPAIVAVSSPHWQHVDTRVRNHMALVQGLDAACLFDFPHGLSAPCCVASSTPILNVGELSWATFSNQALQVFLNSSCFGLQ